MFLKSPAKTHGLAKHMCVRPRKRLLRSARSFLPLSRHRRGHRSEVQYLLKGLSREAQCEY
eukprot:10474882-Alexandrium_andersonii.AAC.1